MLLIAHGVTSRTGQGERLGEHLHCFNPVCTKVWLIVLVGSQRSQLGIHRYLYEPLFWEKLAGRIAADQKSQYRYTDSHYPLPDSIL